MKLVAAIFIFMLILTPLLVSAQQPSPCSSAGFAANDKQLSTFPKCISQIYIWSLGIGGLLALLMTVIGGYSYMTAAGNAERAQKGTEMIWGSVIGLALLFGAYLLLSTINPDLVNFRVSEGACIKDGSSVNAAAEADCKGAGGTWYSITGEASKSNIPTTPDSPRTGSCEGTETITTEEDGTVTITCETK